MRKIIHHFDVKVPTSKVYNTLTEEKGLSGWWTTNVKAESMVGGTIDFVFGNVFRTVMEITDLEKNKKVAWKCIDQAEDWLGDRFTFLLRENEGLTTVTFIQEYTNEITDEQYGRFNFNWGYYLQSMVELCENGSGKPFSGN